VKQGADTAQQVDILGAVIAAPARALDRLELTEAAFPETQYVLWQLKVAGRLANGAERFRRLFGKGEGGRRHALILGFGRRCLAVDDGFENMAGTEHQHAARRDR